MARDVIITPASGLIDFQGSVGVSSATIELDTSGNLNIANPGGDLTLGDTSRDVYIGNGVDNVDIVFEQDGEIRGLTGKTITLGQSDSFIAFGGNITGVTTFIGNIVSPTFTSTQTTGTAPFTVSSTTVVTNLNADLLDGQEGSYYRNATNINDGTLDNARLPQNISVSGIVTASSFSGNISVTETSANASFFPIFASSSTSGNKTLFVDGGMAYNPSTNTLDLFNLNVNTSLRLTDNVELYFGTSNDAWFNYNGTNNYLELQLESAATDFRITDNGTERFRFVKSTGNLGIGTTNPTSRLTVDGDLLVSGVSTFQGNVYLGGISASGIVTATDFNATSDINLKENIRPIQNSSEIISGLEGVRFVWKADGKESIGVIAQEVEKTLPELVSNGNTKTVNYNGLIGVLIEAVKDQQKQIDSLKTEIELLKSR